MLVEYLNIFGYSTIDRIFDDEYSFLGIFLVWFMLLSTVGFGFLAQNNFGSKDFGSKNFFKKISLKKNLIQIWVGFFFAVATVSNLNL